MLARVSHASRKVVVIESEGLGESKWIQQERQKVVCPGGSRREGPNLGFPCRSSKSWLGDKDESHH